MKNTLKLILLLLAACVFVGGCASKPKTRETAPLASQLKSAQTSVASAQQQASAVQADVDRALIGSDRIDSKQMLVRRWILLHSK